MLLLQGVEVTTKWTVILAVVVIIGQIVTVALGKWSAKEVKKELVVATKNQNRRLKVIHVLVNSTLSQTQKHVELLTKQIQDAGLEPVPPPPVSVQPLVPLIGPDDLDDGDDIDIIPAK